mgnify:CR=1 FL=1
MGRKGFNTQEKIIKILKDGQKSGFQITKKLEEYKDVNKPINIQKSVDSALIALLENKKIRYVF